MISMMRVGVNSMVGSFVISGLPTIADNACRIFQTNGVISEHGSLPEAARYARNFSAGVPGMLTDKITRSFTVMHEQIVEEVENVPPSLSAAFSAFEAKPSAMGIARYFNLLADLLEGALKNRSRPQSS